MPSDAHAAELAELREAFQVFTSASEKLEDSYDQLKRQSEELKLELKEKNEKLIASLKEKERLEKFLEGILQNLPVGIVVTGPSGQIRMGNRKAGEILTTEESQMPGKPYTSLEILRDIPLSLGVSQEKKVDRSVYTCSVSSMNGLPEDDSGWVIMIEDISEMIRWKVLAERQKRLSSMGEMAARIAHEIRNPLGSMELNATMLLEELQGTDRLYALAGRVATGIRTVSHILSNLLHFAKGSDPLWERLDVGRLSAEAVEFASPLLSEKGIGVGGNFWEQSCEVLGDRILLRQALLNLILNAIDAMEEGGQLLIRVEKEEALSASWTDMPVIRVLVEDNGKGIPETDLDRIFDPFFTRRSRGTGLGLAIVNNIVESHQGIIEVESRVGEGSSFVLSLPCAPEDEHGYTADSHCG